MKRANRIYGAMIGWSVGVGLLWIGSAGAAPVQAGEEMQARRLTVTGAGQIRVKPDKIVLTFSVLNEGGDSAAVSRDHVESVRKVKNLLREQGVGEADIQTSNYANNTTAIGGTATVPSEMKYTISNQLQVTVRNLGKIGPILDAVSGLSFDRIDRLNYDLANESPIREQALQKAVADARHKAEFLARTTGIRILGVYELNEGRFSRSSALYMNWMAVGALGPSSPGEITATAEVTIVYQTSPPAAASASKSSLRK